jgi:putative aminopeptidase FrvX
VGDPIVFQKQVSFLANDCLASRGMDNRAGCAVQIKVLEAMAGIKEKPTIHYVFTVQEEYGLRGAATAAYALQPDLSLVVDTASAPDFPGVPSVYQGQFRLGRGPVLRLVDSRMITDRKWVRWVEDLAREKEIPVQRGVTGGSTDAAAVQLVRQGLGVLPICLPCRYTHSLVETVSLRDLDFAAALVQEMLIHFPENDLRKGDGKKSLL